MAPKKTKKELMTILRDEHMADEGTPEDDEQIEDMIEVLAEELGVDLE